MILSKLFLVSVTKKLDQLNPTEREFAGMLPLTAELWHPAPGFADVSIFEGYGEAVTVEIEEGEEIMER